MKNNFKLKSNAKKFYKIASRYAKSVAVNTVQREIKRAKIANKRHYSSSLFPKSVNQLTDF